MNYASSKTNSQAHTRKAMAEESEELAVAGAVLAEEAGAEEIGEGED